MAGPLWTTTYVGKENTLASLDWANPKPNWELITHARVINDRRDDFATPVGAFKTLHFWNRESDEKKETIRKGFDLVTCRMDEDGNVVDEKKFLVLNDAAFVMAGSSSGLASLLYGSSPLLRIPRSVERIGAGGAAELTIHCARIVVNIFTHSLPTQEHFSLVKKVSFPEISFLIKSHPSCTNAD